MLQFARLITQGQAPLQMVGHCPALAISNREMLTLPNNQTVSAGTGRLFAP